MKTLLSLLVFLVFTGNLLFSQQMTVTLTSTNVTCYGACNGTITASVSGGSAPYTYQWSNSIFNTTATANNLCAGYYSLTVTDNLGSTITASASINQPVLLEVTFTTQDPTTIGGTDGSVTANVTGGIPPYLYLWSNSVNTATNGNISAGFYHLTVTDMNGCIVDSVAQLFDPNTSSCQAGFVYNTSPANPYTYVFYDSSFSNSNIINYSWSIDGQIISGSQITYTFNSPGAHVVCYTILSADSCTSTFCDTILVNSCNLSLSAAISPVVGLNAMNGAIDLTVMGGTAPYTYYWSTSAASEDINSLYPGWYYIDVTDGNGCSVNDSFYVWLDTLNTNCQAYFYSYLDSLTMPPVAPYIFVNQSTAGNDFITSYLWDFSDGTVDNVANPAHIFPTGTYYVCLTITTSGGCTSTYCDSLFVNTNPDTICNLTATYIVTPVSIIGGADGSIDVTVSGGTAPYNYLWNNAAATQDLTGIPAGLYSVTITDAAQNCPAVILYASLFEPYDTTGGQIVDSLYTAYVDTCFNFQIDSFYVAQMVINNNNTVTVTWVFEGSGNSYYITVEYTYTETGNQVIFLTINCNGFKTLTTYMSYVHINTISSVSEMQTENNLLAYPVPVSDILNIKMFMEKQADVILSVQNLEGQIIYQKNVNSNAGENLWKVDMESFARGFYIMNITVDGNLKAVRKITK